VAGWRHGGNLVWDGVLGVFWVKGLALDELKVGDWIALGGALVTAVPLVWGAFQYISIKRRETEARNFTVYHELVKNLVETATMIDRQIATVYELRNYPTYFPVSYRILGNLQRSWGALSNPKFENLLEEIRLTRQFIARSGRRYLD